MGNKGSTRGSVTPPVRIGIARDAAFHFYYADNLEALEQAGCELVSFSPVADSHLPPDLHAIYFGGGYPEEHAEALAANHSLRAEVRRFAAKGHPVYAECGGLMYLTREIETRDGRRHAMAGLLPAACRMLDHRKMLGYVEVTLRQASLWGAAGTTLRGHEFHYSELIPTDGVLSGWEPAYAVCYARSRETAAEGFQQGNILASYAHVHFASRPAAVTHFAKQCSS